MSENMTDDSIHDDSIHDGRGTYDVFLYDTSYDVTYRLAWCLDAQGVRNFRTDRIEQVEVLDQRYPKNRQALLAEWRRTEFEPGRSILPETDSMAL